MKEKKNIDKIFKDSLNNIEASPSPRVWENIQAELNKKKRRKVIPLWIQIGGVAAMLALLLTAGNWIFDPLHIQSPSITDGNTNQTQKELEEQTRGTQHQNEVQIASEETKDGNGQTKDENSEKNSVSNHNKTNSYNNVKVASSDKSENILISSEENASVKKKNHDQAIRDIENSLPEGIATAKTSSKEKHTESKEGIIIKKSEKDNFPIKGMTENALVNEDSENTKAEHDQNSVLKPSIMDAIVQQENLKDGKEKKSVPERRWDVTPNLAPVYYSSFGSGSSIDPDFDNNPQKGDVNMSYGVQVSYAVNNRLSIRTGLNNVDLSYSTSNILIATGPSTAGLRGVNYGSQQTVVTAISKNTLNNAAPNDFGALNLKSTQGDARLIQNINYYEVPLELQYAVIESRFGVNLIGGISTMFLGNNEISVKADNFSSVLGAANNLSSVSFSTNVGLGLDYKLSKKFTFNIEPIFKYQLNPYSDSSVDFKPYYLGVYSGLSFKF